MKLHDLSPPEGSNEDGLRKGRGRGAKQGEFCGRGIKGQKKRNQIPIYFEGGQTPIYRRFPKRGFNHHQSVEVEIVNVGSLNDFDDGSEVTLEKLEKQGLVNDTEQVKLLGDGTLDSSLTVRVHDASEGAVETVENAGGTVETVTSQAEQEN
jgi:large subunit ribosomal protein L15